MIGNMAVTDTGRASVIHHSAIQTKQALVRQAPADSVPGGSKTSIINAKAGGNAMAARWS